MELSKSSKKFVLVDVHALLHRAYHAYPATLSANGVQTNAVYGFAVLLLEVVKKFDPDYMVCCIDQGKATNRIKIFKEYKANRKPTEQELLDQIPLAYELIEKAHIPLFGMEGYEADDLIGTLVTKFDTKKGENGEKIETIIVTGDKDIFQLVDDNTFVYLAGGSFSGSKLYGDKEVEEKMGFGPEFVVDYKALRGDPSDNIPGVAGIGDKGAKELIDQFGHLDDILKNISNVEKNRTRNSLAKGVDDAKLSFELAKIDTKVDVNFDLQDAKFEEMGNGDLIDFFDRLQFRSLVKRFSDLKKSSNQLTKSRADRQMGLFSASSPDIHDQGGDIIEENPNYIIADQNSLKEIISKLGKAKEFAFDTETDSLDTQNCKMLGFSFSFETNKAFYIPSELFEDRTSVVYGQIKEIFENQNVKKIGHNIKFDVEVLASIGIEVKGVYFDTMLAYYILHMGEASVGLKYLAREFLAMQMKDFKELITQATKKNDFSTIPLEILGPYACADADATYRLYNLVKTQLAKDKSLEKLFFEIEMPIVDILVEMEKNGIGLDVDYLLEFSEELDTKMANLREDIIKLAGVDFNLNSPKQVGEILFGKLGLTATKKTSSGVDSTNERALQDIAGVHEIVPLILEYREVAKLRSTYTDNLIKQKNAKTGRVHTNYNQAIASTGRLSSNDPNLQNIPIATELGGRIRKAFVPDEGKIFLSMDYSQQELRILASVSKDDNLLETYKKGMDVHALTASKLFGIKIDEVSKLQRAQGKTVNFSVIYGISAFGLGDRLKIPQGLAQEFIDKYFETYPGVKVFFEKLLADAKTKDYIETAYGRRRSTFRLKSGNFRVRNGAKREIINFPIQGGAADMMKKAMILVDEVIDDKRWEDYKMLLQVHDELLFEIPFKQTRNSNVKMRNDNHVGNDMEIEELMKDKNFRDFVEIVRKAMLEANIYDIPMKVDVGVGKNWGEIE